jgi:hypothetical protein
LHGREANPHLTRVSQQIHSRASKALPGDTAGQMREDDPMTRLVLVTFATLLALGACRDTRALPTANKAALSKIAIQKTATSTVCAAYSRKLRVMKVRYKHTPTAALGNKINSLGAVVTDACN